MLAWITYYFIEKKIRHKKSPWTVPILVATFAVTGFVGVLVSSELIKSYFSFTQSGVFPKAMINLDKATKDFDMLNGLNQVKKDDLFYINKTGGDGLQTLFLGDSNMQQYAPRLLNLLKNNKLNNRGAILITECGVPPFAHTINNQSRDSALLISSFTHELESNPKVDRVVIASRWCTYFVKNSRWKTDGMSLGVPSGQQKAMEELDCLIKNIAKHDKKIFLVLNIPTGSELDPKKMYPRNFVGSMDSRKKVLTKESFLRENGTLLANIAAVARKNGAEVIDPLDYLCTNGICIAEDEKGVPIRFDEGHLRPGYVREHVKYLDHTVEP